jgi:hypothetical protein
MANVSGAAFFSLIALHTMEAGLSKGLLSSLLQEPNGFVICRVLKQVYLILSSAAVFALPRGVREAQ